MACRYLIKGECTAVDEDECPKKFVPNRNHRARLLFATQQCRAYGCATIADVSEYPRCQHCGVMCADTRTLLIHERDCPGSKKRSRKARPAP